MNGERCRRDDIDRVSICTCPGCEMYRDQNYKLRVARLAKRDDERWLQKRERALIDLTT